MDCPSLDYMLHATELAVVISLAYIGFDRAGGKTNKIEAFTIEVKEIYSRLCNRLDPMEEGELKESLNTDEFYIIARIAGESNLTPPNDSRQKTVRAWYKKHCRHFGFFYKRYDYYLALALFAISFATYMTSIWVGISGGCIDGWLAHIIMAGSVVVCLVIFYFVLSAHRIFELPPKLDELKSVIERRVTKLKKEKVLGTLDDLEDAVRREEATAPPIESA